MRECVSVGWVDGWWARRIHRIRYKFGVRTCVGWKGTLSLRYGDLWGVAGGSWCETSLVDVLAVSQSYYKNMGNDSVGWDEGVWVGECGWCMWGLCVVCVGAVVSEPIILSQLDKYISVTSFEITKIYNTYLLI